MILNLLNDAWSNNWGFVPLTESEIAYAGKKLKPIIFEELVRIAEYDGEPVAFMITIPDINELIKDLNGELFPFNWVKLLWRLRKPRTERARVPLMGVAKTLHGSRLASQLAFMMIEFTRRDAVGTYGIQTASSAGSSRTTRGCCRSPSCPEPGSTTASAFTKRRSRHRPRDAQRNHSCLHHRRADGRIGHLLHGRGRQRKRARLSRRRRRACRLSAVLR